MLIGAGTLAFFSEWEISEDNFFEAGAIDLRIDCHSTHMRTFPEQGMYGPYEVELPITFEEKDLVPGDKFFNWHDVKPGDYGEATISFHVYDNDAWGWFCIANVQEGSFATPEPEPLPDEGELAENIETYLWIDDGEFDGWQGTGEDPYEGDNIWQEAWEELIYEGTLYDLYLFEEWVGPYYMEKCTTYYIGWYWNVPTEASNDIQADWLEFDIAFYAEQHRNNPNPQPPEPPENIPPVADAGGPYRGTIGIPLTLDGSGSYDSDGIITEYLWDLDDDGEFDDASGPFTDYTWFSEGLYPIHLKVIDDDGAEDTDSTTADISEEENLPPYQPEDPTPLHTSEYEDVYDITLECLVTDPEEDSMDVSFYWSDHTLIGTVIGVVHNTRASLYLPDYIDPDWLNHDTTYEWYVIVADSFGSTTGPVWTFHTCVAWDMNLDRTIDGFDVSILSAHYGDDILPPGSEPWDINNDGTVDGFDVSILTSHYGESY